MPHLEAASISPLTHYAKRDVFCYVYMHVAVSACFSECSFPVKVIKLLLKHSVFHGTQIMLQWLVTEPDVFTRRVCWHVGCKSVSHLEMPIRTSVPPLLSVQDRICFLDRACHPVLTAAPVITLNGWEELLKLYAVLHLIRVIRCGTHGETKNALKILVKNVEVSGYSGA